MSDASPEPTTTKDEVPSMLEACTPRQDVLIGELAEDQFAASLADVAHSDDAPEVYADPGLFFEKTYPTDGLQELLGRLAIRFVSYHNGEYSGTNGVLRLDTSFGGGKTHNQIAAYHLAKQPEAVPDLSDFVEDKQTADGYGEAAALGLDVNTAVFVGTHVDGTSARCDYTDPSAPETKTMWGELAYQLFGQEGYEFLRENDEERSPPGSQKLERLFDRHSDPSLVLIDEIAAYLEQTAAVEVGDSTLAKQTNTFLMSLLSATQNTDQLTVILSIADTAFHDRAEDVRGLVSETISEFNTITDRTEGSITPTEDNEVASVLCYRLFEEAPESARTATADAYASFYNGDRESFPESATPMDHRDQLKDSYPIHPTVIDTLTEELDSLPSFQKTRGALRLLSRGIHQLWSTQAEQHERHFVRLFDLHPSDSNVFTTLLRLFNSVEMDFEAAIKADIYSDDGTANAEEEDRKWTAKGHPPLGSHLTTTVLWKSIVKSADGRGTTRRPIRHAVAHLDVELAHYDDALNNLLGEGRQSACFYLHGDAGEKIQFKAEANLTKLIDSVVDRLKEGLARRHLKEALDSALGQGSLNVVVGPEEPHEIDDVADEAHLCVMNFDTVSVRNPEDVPEVIQTLYENHASSSGGQNRQLDRPHLGAFATTPRRVAASRREQVEERTVFLELLHETDLSWKQAAYLGEEIIHCWEYTAQPYGILAYDQFDTATVEKAVEQVRHLDTTSRYLTDHEIDETTDLAIIGYPQLTELERSILPSDYDTVDRFTSKTFDQPPFRLFDTSADIINTILSTVDEETAEKVAIVLDASSEFSPLVESALDAADIPFYGGPGFLNEPDHRTFLQLLRIAFRGDDVRMSDVKPVLQHVGRQVDIDHEEKRLHSLDAFEGHWLVDWCNRIQAGDVTFETALSEYETRLDGAALHEFREELHALGFASQPVTEPRVDDPEFYFQSYEIPIDRENEGVPLADAKSATHVDRPLVFYPHIP